ncbi:MAG: bifunctional folylpolyglutamate synthase/dihydrofolate synthase [Chitinophagaceae bacterium]|nr:bifunctional folylpolyglutamate synthase/dihydrofolate synthase [Chitinophagaceae bacterium]MCE2759176.1 bifunctional folylpolyglutamate synthase/dihydrofolate synthase [Chitinophagaceae bacterium]
MLAKLDQLKNKRRFSKRSFPIFLNNQQSYICSVDYTSCLEYLYSKLPMFSRTGPAAIKPSLDNTIALCDHLGLPHQTFKSIHVAGTNGKGSVSHMLASIFQEHGFKTGLYTSPHIKDFRERIKINGQMVEKDFVVKFTNNIRDFIENKEPSFFEVTVGMAFQYFAENKIDIAIIETGLGGRLDSTNVIDPVISVITNIGFDHMSILGNTLEAIASEKAGIIKNNKSVVIGKTNPLTAQVFIDKASTCGSKIIFADQAYQVDNISQENDLLRFDVKKNSLKRTIESRLNSLYQLENIRTVVATIDELNLLGYQVREEEINHGIAKTVANTGLRGRWEKIHDRPKTIIDVGHNPDGIREILRQLSLTPYKHLYIILGLSKDKDYPEILSMLPKDADYAFTQANIPRALDATTLNIEAKKFELKGRSFNNVNDALAEIRLKAKPDDLILICGSLFLIGELDF